MYKLNISPTYVKPNRIFIYLQHMGVPLYQSSFDAYSFMVLLMSEPVFYRTVKADLKLSEIWESMWMPEEYEDVIQGLENLHRTDKDITALQIVQFLSRFRLRCDGIEMVWQQLRRSK